MAKASVAITSAAQEPPASPRKVLVPLEMGEEEVVELDAAGAELQWDARSFPSYGEDLLRKLSFENARRYFVAQGEARAAGKRREQEREFGKAMPVSWARDRLEFQTDKLRLRERRGWHQTWCRGDQLDDFRNAGYMQVRWAKEGTEEAAGSETGEVIKIKEGEDRFLIAVEIPQDVYDEHIRAMAYRSQVRYSYDVRETFREHMDGINRDYGTKKEILQVVDDLEEGQEVLRGGGTGSQGYRSDEKD